MFSDKNKKNYVIVLTRAGTGKTFTMISRIAYICHVQNCSMKEMVKRIVMITFTDDAANQMEDKIKQHFNNYYLLTGDGDCLAFINQIEGMQISTIHSYAKKMISVLGLELGYGIDVSVTSGDYKAKQIIADLVDKYISQKQKEYGDSYVRKLGMPVYLINKDILKILTRLHNQSIDVSQLKADNFGEMISGGTDGEFHKLIQDIIPKVEIELDAYLKKQNKIHLNNMMSTLQLCIEKKENVERLIKMQTGRPQYMFVDEFQDTDDVQIDAILQIARLLQYKLFVVGDVKQCIYRFRGARENAFKQLGADHNPEWQTYSLYKNYRTDAQLLDVFHSTFYDLGNRTEGGEPLLIYKENGTGSDTDRLIGIRDYNRGINQSEFYKKILIAAEEERIPAVFEEVRRIIKRIKSIEEQGVTLSDKDKEIAILVRENWQAESIKQAGKRMGFEVLTNTGGVSDADMNKDIDELLPWPLSEMFIERAYNPKELPFQVYYTALGEKSNFLRYALFYGLYFNQCESKISFVKRYGDNTTDLYEMLKLIGVEKADGPAGERMDDCKISTVVKTKPVSSMAYDREQMADMFLCPYRYLFDFVLNPQPIFSGTFLFQKLYENLLITNVWQQLVNKPMNDAVRVLPSVVSAESQKMKSYFPFFRETEILDLKRRAENYIIHSVFREGDAKVRKYEPTHMRLRENFGNALFAENGQDYPEAHPYKAFENITKWEEGRKIYGLHDIPAYEKKELIEATLQYLNDTDENMARAGSWCVFCPNKGICLESYAAENK